MNFDGVVLVAGRCGSDDSVNIPLRVGNYWVLSEICHMRCCFYDRGLDGN